MNNLQSQLPEFLQDYDSFNQYIRDSFEFEENTYKGDAFIRFIEKIFPLTKWGSQFKNIQLSRSKSHDGGVDLIADNDDGLKIMYGQSKLTIKSVEEVDSILSKFQNYYEKNIKSDILQFNIFNDETLGNTKPNNNSESELIGGRKRSNKRIYQNVDKENQPSSEPYFVVFTLSRIDNILLRYEKSFFASKEFYSELKNSGRIMFVDGPTVFPLVQSQYRKLHIIPSDLELNFVGSFIKHENVYIGIISAKELKKLYHEFGDALFFENIRVFLGYSENDGRSETVNNSIKKTAEDQPQEMLARNNGITLRANKASTINATRLRLEQASIVNGCQTTMCIVEAKNENACVLVKIVEVNDSWAVAKSANYQNTVKQIALDVARYMRPQILNRAAGKAGITVENDKTTLNSIFESIYRDRVRYDDIFNLFLGIFSASPINILNKDYGSLRSDVLQKMQEEDPEGELIFEMLFAVYKMAEKSRKDAESRYQESQEDKETFQRFWKEDNSAYSAILTILASCGSVGINIYDTERSFEVIQEFREKLMKLLANDQKKFMRYYRIAIEAVFSYLTIKGEDKSVKERQRRMYDDLRSADIKSLYKDICRRGQHFESLS